MIIRPATPSDVSVIYQFVCDLEETTLDNTRFQDVFNCNIVNPTIHYLVAETDDRVTGFVSCHVQPLLHHAGSVGEIQELYIRPDRRNRQVGHQLLDHLTTLAHRNGWVSLEVATNRKRADTVRFYERESFRCTHYKLVKTLSV